jgi:hypothetical protein
MSISTWLGAKHAFRPAEGVADESIPRRSGKRHDRAEEDHQTKSQRKSSETVMPELVVWNTLRDAAHHQREARDGIRAAGNSPRQGERSSVGTFL